MDTSTTQMALPKFEFGRLGACDHSPSTEQTQAEVADCNVDAAAKTEVVETGR